MAVVVLSQINRSGEEKPTLAELNQGGEQSPLAPQGGANDGVEQEAYYEERLLRVRRASLIILFLFRFF